MLVLVGIWVVCCFCGFGVCLCCCMLFAVRWWFDTLVCLFVTCWLLCAGCVVAVWVGCFGGFFRFSGVGCVVGSCVWHLRWFWVVDLAVCLLWLICLFIVRIGVAGWFRLF